MLEMADAKSSSLATSGGAPVSSPGSMNSAAPVPMGVPQSELELVNAFSRLTGMNLRFSEQCLRENKWHFDAAVNNYNELKVSLGIAVRHYRIGPLTCFTQMKGVIPPEAYQP